MGCGLCGTIDCPGGLSCPVNQSALMSYSQQNAYAQQQAIANTLMQQHVLPANWLNATTITSSGNFISGPISPSQPLESGGMKVEDLTGWRIWRVKHGHLWSYSADYAWMPGEVSEGDPGDHDSAGVWAFKEKRRAFQKAMESGDGFVWGSVRLWGHVVEHKDGYRASKARIVSLDGATRDVTPEAMADLCRVYGVAEVALPARTVKMTVIRETHGALVGELPSLPEPEPELHEQTQWPLIQGLGVVLFALFVFLLTRL